MQSYPFLSLCGRSWSRWVLRLTSNGKKDGVSPYCKQTNGSRCVIASFSREDYPEITIGHGRSQPPSPWPNCVVLCSVWPDGFLSVPNNRNGTESGMGGVGGGVAWGGELGFHIHPFHLNGCGRVIVATNWSCHQLWSSTTTSVLTA